MGIDDHSAMSLENRGDFRAELGADEPRVVVDFLGNLLEAAIQSSDLVGDGFFQAPVVGDPQAAVIEHERGANGDAREDRNASNCFHGPHNTQGSSESIGRVRRGRVLGPS